MARQLDFIVIGAQKAATTSLFRYLDDHPRIYMPPEKETGFFSDAAKYDRGLDVYHREHFGNADESQIWGEASPQYMYCPRAASRIRASLPRVKLIALLRNPIERAYSHYRMAVSRGLEQRTFLQCVEALASRGRRDHEDIDPEMDFLAVGEYARALGQYVASFDRSQIAVVFTEDLASDPRRTVAQLYEFVGVSAEHPVANLDQRYNVGGVARLPHVTAALSRGWLRAGVRAVIPAQLRRQLGFWLLTEFSVRPTPDPGPDRAARELLVEYYKDDVVQLESLLGASPPWKAFSRERC